MCVCVRVCVWGVGLQRWSCHVDVLDMAATERDLAIEAGTSFRLRFTWLQPTDDPAVPGVPYDLSGAHAWMELRQRYGSEALLRVDSLEYGGIVIEPEEVIPGSGDANGDGVQYTRYQGCIEVRLRPEQTVAVKVRRGRYDLAVQLPAVDPSRPQDVEVYRVLQGTFEMSRNVTLPVPRVPLVSAMIVVAPGGLGVPVSSAVNLSWPEQPSVSYYEVLRDGVQLVTTLDPSYVDHPSTGSHIYVVRAHNVFGQSADSDPVPVQIYADTPVVPDPVVPGPVVPDPVVPDPVVPDPVVPVVVTDPSTPVVGGS